eukprot:5028426-Prymnesium_polylepis.1
MKHLEYICTCITYPSTIIGSNTLATAGETSRDAVMSARHGEAQSTRSNCHARRTPCAVSSH